MPLMRPGQVQGLPVQAFDHLARVAVQARLPVQIAAKLGDPAAQGVDLGQRPGLLIPQRIALQGQALQDGAGDRLLLALWRQGILGRLARPGRRTRRSFGLPLRDQPLAQCAFCHHAGLIGLAPAPPQEHPFGLAQFFRQFAVPRRLLGLPGQDRQLLRQSLQHVIDPQQVLLRARQFQLGLMPPRVKTADPRRLFQHPATRFRLGTDQFGNLPLPHQGRGMRPGRGIGKQHLHVARPHFFRVAAVGRACVPGDPPHNLDLVGIVEARGCQPVAVVHDQRHLGEMPGPPGGSAVEDHVFHAAAAHRRGAIFPHHPAQSLQKVRLAAAIGADHAGQPLMNHQIRGVDKAFEAVQPQFGQTHRYLTSRKARCSRPALPESTQLRPWCPTHGRIAAVIHNILRGRD